MLKKGETRNAKGKKRNEYRSIHLSSFAEIPRKLKLQCQLQTIVIVRKQDRVGIVVVVLREGKLNVARIISRNQTKSQRLCHAAGDEERGRQEDKLKAESSQKEAKAYLVSRPDRKDYAMRKAKKRKSQLKSSQSVCRESKRNIGHRGTWRAEDRLIKPDQQQEQK